MAIKYDLYVKIYVVSSQRRMYSERISSLCEWVHNINGYFQDVIMTSQNKTEESVRIVEINSFVKNNMTHLLFHMNFSSGITYFHDACTIKEKQKSINDESHDYLCDTVNYDL